MPNQSTDAVKNSIAAQIIRWTTLVCGIFAITLTCLTYIGDQGYWILYHRLPNIICSIFLVVLAGIWLLRKDGFRRFNRAIASGCLVILVMFVISAPRRIVVGQLEATNRTSRQRFGTVQARIDVIDQWYETEMKRVRALPARDRKLETSKLSTEREAKIKEILNTNRSSDRLTRR